MHARYQRPQAQARSVRGQETECGVPLEHLQFRWADHPHLEEVIHDPQRVKAQMLDRLGNTHQLLRELGRSTGHAEVRKLNADPHSYAKVCTGLKTGITSRA